MRKLFVILGIIVIGVIIYFLGNNMLATEKSLIMSTDTSSVDTYNWRTYMYEEAGFSIQYPNTWVANLGLGEELFLNNKPNSSDQLQVSWSPEDRSLEFIVKDRIGTTARAGGGKLKPKTLTFAGEVAYEVFGVGDITTIHNDILYEFSITNPNDLVMVKMLQTVRFLN